MDDVTVHKFSTCAGEFIDLISEKNARKKKEKTSLGDEPHEHFLFRYFGSLT